MAGKGAGVDSAGRHGNRSFNTGARPQRRNPCQYGNGQTMLRAIVRFTSILIFCWLPLFWASGAHAAITVSSARVWPAQDYTRLTLESKQAIRHNMFTVSDPERLVIDLEDVEPGSALNELAQLIGNDDPYIKSVRMGLFKPGVVRLVLDLKSEVK